MMNRASIASAGALLVSSLMLGGCNPFQSAAEERINDYMQVFETKLTNTVNATVDGVVDSVSKKIGGILDTAVATLKTQLANAAHDKINEWFDTHLPNIDPENLTDDEYAELLNMHPELAEMVLEEVTDLDRQASYLRNAFNQDVPSAENQAVADWRDANLPAFSPASYDHEAYKGLLTNNADLLSLVVTAMGG